MYEGKAPDGVPGEELRYFHMQITKGGIGMTTLGDCTTEADGRINDQMMYLHEGIKPQLSSSVADLKAAQRNYELAQRTGVTSEYVAARILKAIKKKSIRIRVGKDGVLLDWLKRWFPNGVQKLLRCAA